jgi:hypothetical protein
MSDALLPGSVNVGVEAVGMPWLVRCLQERYGRSMGSSQLTTPRCIGIPCIGIIPGCIINTCPLGAITTCCPRCCCSTNARDEGKRAQQGHCQDISLEFRQ